MFEDYKHRRLSNAMLSFRRVFLPKGLVGSFSGRIVHSRSQFTQAYLEEQEGLFKYTRGRWLYNEREREYLQVVYTLNLRQLEKDS